MIKVADVNDAILQHWLQVIISYVGMSLAKVEAGERHGAGAGRELTRGGDAQGRGAGGAEVSVYVRIRG